MKIFGKGKSPYSRAAVLTLAVLAVAGLALMALSVSASNSKTREGRFAPLNPDFVRYMKDREEGRTRLQFTTDGHALGDLPLPIDLSLWRPAPPVSAEGLPAKYDLRTRNKLTPVKDQGSCGSCWSFATYGSLESTLKPGQTWDFSEQNLIDHHGYDWTPCEGGNLFLSAAYLSRWGGPVLETADPYIYTPPQDGALAVQKHVQNIYYVPGKKNASDNSKIKQMVYTKGAVHVSMSWVESAWNSETNSFYFSGSTAPAGSGHAIAIVGWDDTYPKTKFTEMPGGNGAFLVRNSWGSTWGEQGYFWVSYYDSFFAKGTNVVYTGEAATNYKSIYQYDTLGWTGWGYGFGSETGWFANIFTAATNDPLAAVGFFATGNTNVYEVSIYTNVTAAKPTSGTLAIKKKGTLSSMGYFTVKLGTKITIKKGQKFSVVVKLKTVGYDYPIPLEYPDAGFSSKATAKAGQSFVSEDGKDWGDVIKDAPKTNVCLKAFTSN